MTELLYLHDHAAGYERTFRARVTALPPGAVVLDRTGFYPAGGGQRSDRGLLRLPDGSSAEVVDVTKSGDAVVHRLARGTKASFVAGVEVVGEVDWPRRYRHMRLHTGQHLLSAIIFRAIGLRTLHASMTESSGTLELESLWPEAASLDGIARDVARSVAAALDVRIRHIPRSEWTSDTAPRSGLVAVPANVDPVRVIEIDTLDRCPCGGTHVRSTSEIGPMSLEAPAPSAGPGSRIGFTLGEASPTTLSG